ncbi:MAG TPA: sugar phosphate isomerase/epimerase family protein [Chthonomonadaceae bacterium]|nr:sugar phosphate isomerase/epimerase family protein [Chthonomonadaceae bacterium]
MRADTITRRAFLSATAGAALAAAGATGAARAKHLPVGLELYSVRDELAKDLMGTVRAVAKMGYEVVEFYAPYYQWTPDYARDVRKLLDELNVKCLSTHNNRSNFEGDGLKKAIELNEIIGSKTIVMASAGRTDTQDDWKRVADTLTHASELLKPLKMRAGYHNHQAEFTERDGFRPMPFLAANTPKDVTLQFDVGTSVEVGYDPVAWVEANPGRIRSMHLKDWGKGEDRGFKVLFGEGDTPWKPLIAAAERKGGVEYVLIEQEGSRYPSLETAERCLANYRKLRAER